MTVSQAGAAGLAIRTATLVTVLLVPSLYAQEWFRQEPMVRPRPAWDGQRLLRRIDFDQDFERIVVKFREETGVRVRHGGLGVDGIYGPPRWSPRYRQLKRDLRRVEKIAARHGLRPTPLFPLGERRLELWRERVQRVSGFAGVDLNHYVSFELSDLGRRTPVEKIARTIVSIPSVEVVYPETLTVHGFEASVGPMDIAAPGITPTFLGMQGYLQPAPKGVDAFFAWSVPGGAGLGIRVNDVDTGVNENHEDLPDLFSSDGQGYDPAHGTATLGVIAARDNGIGLKGIAFAAEVGMELASNLNSAAVIQTAVMEVSPGDVVLTETGKTLNGWDCPCNPTQAGNVAQEVYPAQFDVIRMATQFGVIVVEAGGNGCVDYDDESFDGWFDRNVQDSGAIIVGAGLSTAREPTCYSPYGHRIDLHAWAEDITCLEFVRPTEDPVFDAGPGRLYGPNFGGTSGATAIVAGVVASLQGAYQNQFIVVLPPLSPETIRQLLVATGTPQSDQLDRPIGSMPDLQAAIQALP